MAHRREFYLYKRHKKGGDYWYVCFLDKETGKAGTAKSIDCIKERLGIMDYESVKRKEDAAVIAQKALECGLFGSRRGDVLFSSWCLDFWDYDNSEYIALRNRLQENSIGREYAYNMRKNFEKNVKPLLPEGLKLVNVTTAVLDRVVRELCRSDKQNGTVEIIIYSFSLPLKEAVRLGIIPSNPADRDKRGEGPRCTDERGGYGSEEGSRREEGGVVSVGLLRNSPWYGLRYEDI